MKVPVLIPKIFNFPFTYDSGILGNLKLGDLVIVPFGKNQEIGVIWDKIQPSSKGFKIRKVEKKIDSSHKLKKCKIYNEIKLFPKITFTKFLNNHLKI